MKRSNVHHPRSLKLTELRWCLRHVPTGVEVHGLSVGYYSRRELTEQRQRLIEVLWPLLEQRVARHLRIAGR
jgi:hypothetical protein